MTRPGIIDEGKQREILAILAVGCSRRTAARYVGCHVTTIKNTMERIRSFAEKVRKVEVNAEVAQLKNIREAAKHAQYWRAAAWMLEKINPEEYANCIRGTISEEQVSETMRAFAAIVVEEVPDSRKRKRILARLERTVEALKEESKSTLRTEEQASQSAPQGETDGEKVG